MARTGLTSSAGRTSTRNKGRYCEIDFDTGCRLAKFFYTLGRINWQTHAAASTPLLASVQSVQPDRAQNAPGIKPPSSLYPLGWQMVPRDRKIQAQTSFSAGLVRLQARVRVTESIFL